MTNLWWGYLHENDSLHVKRYWDIRDIQEAKASPFCKVVYGPFKARNRKHAMEKLIKLEKIRHCRLHTGRSIRFSIKALVETNWELSKAYDWIIRYAKNPGII